MLTKDVNIREGIRSTASTSQQNLRDFLQSESERDPYFPRVLKRVDCDFIGGSFGRHTKIRPLDDIDIYVPLEGTNLYYQASNGSRFPFTVLSDSAGWNPLLTPRWANGQLVSSFKLIDEFAAVLKRRFPQTKVRDGRQAVSVQMTHGETSTNDGLGYDVVPCFSLLPHHKDEQHFYLIADGKGGWVHTNPRIDDGTAKVLQDQHNQLFRKAVKILKYWNAERLDGGLNSYFVELSIARVFWDKAVRSDSVTTLSYGVALGFWAVQQALVRGSQEPWLRGAQPVYPGALALGRRVSLKGATDLACAAWEDEKANSLVSAVAKWKQIFGEKFPD
jgi:hypothetical protein